MPRDPFGHLPAAHADVAGIAVAKEHGALCRLPALGRAPPGVDAHAVARRHFDIVDDDPRGRRFPVFCRSAGVI